MEADDHVIVKQTDGLRILKKVCGCRCKVFPHLARNLMSADIYPQALPLKLFCKLNDNQLGAGPAKKMVRCQQDAFQTVPPHKTS